MRSRVAERFTDRLKSAVEDQVTLERELKRS